jgi:hypothetical protein
MKTIYMYFHVEILIMKCYNGTIFLLGVFKVKVVILMTCP